MDFVLNLEIRAIAAAIYAGRRRADAKLRQDYKGTPIAQENTNASQNLTKGNDSMHHRRYPKRTPRNEPDFPRYQITLPNIHSKYLVSPLYLELYGPHNNS